MTTNTEGRFLVQVKNPDGLGWLNVAARDTWETAEAFAAERQARSGIEHRVALLPKIPAPEVR